MQNDDPDSLGNRKDSEKLIRYLSKLKNAFECGEITEEEYFSKAKMYTAHFVCPKLALDKFGPPTYKEIANFCAILRFFNLLGRNWSFPLFSRLEGNREYSFEELFKLTNKMYNRTSISNFLKEMITLKVIQKKAKRYSLTKEGIAVKEECDKIRKILSKSNKENIEFCKELCNKMRFFCKEI